MGLWREDLVSCVGDCSQGSKFKQNNGREGACDVCSSLVPADSDGEWGGRFCLGASLGQEDDRSGLPMV